MKQSYKIVLLSGLIAFASSCKKLIEINPPTKTIPTEKVFESPEMVNAAVAGMYSHLATGIGAMTFSNGAFTIYAGMSADELVNSSSVNDADDYQFLSNTININNEMAGSFLWTPAYQAIYMANAIVEGVAQSESPLLTDSVRIQATAEARFVRAFCYFYLVNAFGDVPLVLTTDYTKTVQMSRTPVTAVYAQIEQDLTDAQTHLGNDYAISNGERVRPNRWAATALLARVQLYQKKWAEAEKLATEVMNAGWYRMPVKLDSVFLKNSQESIWQLMLNNTNSQPGNVTWEGKNFVPNTRYTSYDPAFQSVLLDPDVFTAYLALLVPSYYMSTQLSGAFEPGDQRKVKWTDSLPTPAIAPYNGATLFFGFKYTSPKSVINGPIAQYYTVFRLAEQYLIRAEARAQQNNLAGAAEDVNIIRRRAGLPNTTAASQPALLDAIAQERRIELFLEWGHRWLDLKRTNKAGEVLGQIPYKQPWQPTQLLYPIPAKEVSDNRNILQNPGY